jgi:hypothetical protein
MVQTTLAAIPFEIVSKNPLRSRAMNPSDPSSIRMGSSVSLTGDRPGVAM